MTSIAKFIGKLEDKSFTGWVRLNTRRVFVALGSGFPRDSPEYMNEYNKINNSHINALRRDRYNKRLKAGLCPKCGKKPEFGLKLCKKHQNKRVTK